MFLGHFSQVRKVRVKKVVKKALFWGSQKSDVIEKNRQKRVGSLGRLRSKTIVPPIPLGSVKRSLRCWENEILMAAKFKKYLKVDKSTNSEKFRKFPNALN